jgi:hypothetical protein
MDASTTGLEPGTLVGEHVVVKRLRVDGDAVVRRAQQTSVDRTVGMSSVPSRAATRSWLARAPSWVRLAGGRPLERVLAELTQLVQAPARGRLTVVNVGSHAVVILKDILDGRSLPESQKLLASLRLG